MSDSPLSSAIADFEQEIAHQEDIVYGVALFFECLALIHADNDAIMETCRKQLRNVIENSNEHIRHARQLVEDAKKDVSIIPVIKDFTFSPCASHPNPEGMTRRAITLNNAYKTVFPDRAKAKDFTEEEIFRLIEEASLAFE